MSLSTWILIGGIVLSTTLSAQAQAPSPSENSFSTQCTKACKNVEAVSQKKDSSRPNNPGNLNFISETVHDSYVKVQEVIEARKARKRRKEERQAEIAARNSPSKDYGKVKSIGKQIAKQNGWTGKQWHAMNKLIAKESGWNPRARNPSSGAYGLPQALPGRKMASAGKDWRTNPRTQLEWFAQYVKQRYGTPLKAWRHSQKHNWY